MRCGAESTNSLTDLNERSRVVSGSWQFVRREVLRAHSWNSTTLRAVLTAAVTSPLWGFDSAYDLPADCLRVFEVDTNYDWRVEGDQILTDGTGDLNIRYGKDETDPSKYDSMLTEAIVLRLAVEIVERVTDSTTKRSALLNEYDDLLSDAKAADGEEQSPAEFEEDDWILARY